MGFDVVCLCDTSDLKRAYAPVFAAYPEIRLLRPNEVPDPTRIRHAFAYRPGPGAFAPYPNLGLIVTAAAGVDGLMAHPELPPGVAITRMVDDGQARMMAAFALHYITGWHRRFWDYPARARARRWDAVNMTPPERFQVGLLGFGNMARTLARTLLALGYPVQAWASRARSEAGVNVLSGADGLHHVVAKADALVNLLPLTPQTQGILNKQLFAQMKDDAMLIQLGRGAHLEEADLLAGLSAGRPAMAAMDVFAQEPPQADNPLWDHPQVLFTPHIASDTQRPAIAARVAEIIAAFERGAPLTGQVDRTRGY